MGKAEVWSQWVDLQGVDDGVPLFDTDENDEVKTEQFGSGSHERSVLQRSAPMEAMVIEQAEKVEDDFKAQGRRYEGLIYVMYWADSEGGIIPLYIGKCGKFETSGSNLNPNLRSIRQRKSRFARWGYGTAFHLGQLSQIFFDSSWEYSGQAPNSSKGRWIQTLFDPRSRRLTQEVYLWIGAWKLGDTGPYTPATGASPFLEELEYQLIGLAWDLYPKLILNTEGLPANTEAYAQLHGWSDQSEFKDF